MPTEHTAGLPRRGGEKTFVEPKKPVIDLRELAQGKASTVIDALMDMVEDEETPPTARIAAAKELLDRGFGRTPLAADAPEETSKAPVHGVVILPAEIDE
jgi:hypothetical protein